MGKISVFKFRLGDSADENEVKALIESYLAENFHISKKPPLT